MKWRIPIVVAVALALCAGLAAGCGGDDDGDGDKLSSQQTLAVAQYRADIVEFCSKSEALREGTTLDAAVDGVDKLIAIYQADPTKRYEFQNVDDTMTEVVRKAAARLERCGSLGRAQAQKLESALQ